MHIITKTKNIELTESMQIMVERKIGSLKKFIKGFEYHSLPVVAGRDLFETFVEVKRETMHHRKGDVFVTEVKMYLPGKTLFAKAHGDNVVRTISDVRDELEREIRKYKTKVVEFPRQKAKKFRKESF